MTDIIDPEDGKDLSMPDPVERDIEGNIPPTNLLKVLEEIKKYMVRSKRKAYYHKLMALRAKEWYNFFSIGSVVLTSGQALTMTVQYATGMESLGITITGGVFAFAITVHNAIKNNFKMHTLSVRHQEISNDFFEVGELLDQMIQDVEYGEFNEKYYTQIVSRFISACQRGPGQPVRRSCFMLCLSEQKDLKLDWIDNV